MLIKHASIESTRKTVESTPEHDTTFGHAILFEEWLESLAAEWAPIRLYGCREDETSIRSGIMPGR